MGEGYRDPRDSSRAIGAGRAPQRRRAVRARIAGATGRPAQHNGCARRIAASLAMLSIHGCGARTGLEADGGASTSRIIRPAVNSLALGYDHSCAIRHDGSVVCWGGNSYGNLGDGTRSTTSSPVVALLRVSAEEITAGATHTCARTHGGAVFCWGFNSNGQLGDGSLTERTSPIAVQGLTDVLQLAAGNLHTCARRIDGSVWCWGFNRVGQLGDGTTVDRSVPTHVPELTDAVDIAAGGHHSCARRSDGSVWCWGSNRSGEIGDGTTMTRTSPVAALGIVDARGVSCGFDMTCALRASGEAVCWGENRTGALGDGTTQSRPVPGLVVGLTDAVDVWCAQDVGNGGFACALRADATVLCWGTNRFGQLGDGTHVNGLFPRTVSGIADAIELNAHGGAHSCARVRGGSVMCWGWNYRGELGDGTMINRATPVRVIGLP